MDNSITEIIAELNKVYGAEKCLEILITLIASAISTVIGVVGQRYAHIGSTINIYKKENIPIKKICIREILSLCIVFMPFIDMMIFWLEVNLHILSMSAALNKNDKIFFLLIAGCLIIGLLGLWSYRFVRKLKYYHIVCLISVSMHLVQVIYVCICYYTTHIYQYVEMITKCTIIISVLIESILLNLLMLKWRRYKYKEQYPIFIKYDKYVMAIIEVILLLALVMWNIDVFFNMVQLGACYVYGLIDLIVTSRMLKKLHPRIVRVYTEKNVYDAVEIKQKDMFLQMELSNGKNILVNSNNVDLIEYL